MGGEECKNATKYVHENVDDQNCIKKMEMSHQKNQFNNIKTSTSLEKVSKIRKI